MSGPGGGPSPSSTRTNGGSNHGTNGTSSNGPNGTNGRWGRPHQATSDSDGFTMGAPSGDHVPVNGSGGASFRDRASELWPTEGGSNWDTQAADAGWTGGDSYHDMRPHDVPPAAYSSSNNRHSLVGSAATNGARDRRARRLSQIPQSFRARIDPSLAPQPSQTRNEPTWLTDLLADESDRNESYERANGGGEEHDHERLRSATPVTPFNPDVSLRLFAPQLHGFPRSISNDEMSGANGTGVMDFPPLYYVPDPPRRTTTGSGPQYGSTQPTVGGPIWRRMVHSRQWGEDHPERTDGEDWDEQAEQW